MRRLPASLWVAPLSLAVVVLLDTLLRREAGLSGDEPFYARMAAHPGGPHTFPYAYRIALPWLVHALPFSQAYSFRLLAWLALAACGGTMFALLVQFDVRPRLAALLSLGLVVSPPLLVAILRNGRSVDPLSTLVMTLGCLFIVRRRRLALTVTLVLGVAVKETALFLIPLAYAVWAERLVDRRALRDALLVAVAPLAGYALLRASIAAVGSQYTPEFRGSFLHVRLSSLGKAFSGVELRRLAYTYGPLWLAAPFALRTVPFARRGLVLVALCVLALTVSFDAGRVLFIAAPVVYVAAASAVRERRALAALLVIALFALDAGYGAYMEAYGLTHGLQTGVSHVPVY